MTLMTVTLMTGNAPKHLFVFLMKLLSCLSHCFRSPIVGFYQQWAFVILHDFDSDRVVVADYITADDASVMFNYNGSTTSPLFMTIIT